MTGSDVPSTVSDRIRVRVKWPVEVGVRTRGLLTRCFDSEPLVPLTLYGSLFSGLPGLDEAVEIYLVEEQLPQIRAAREGHGDAFQDPFGLEIRDCPGRNAQIVGCGLEVQETSEGGIARGSAIDAALRARRAGKVPGLDLRWTPRIRRSMGRGLRADQVGSGARLPPIAADKVGAGHDGG